MASGRTTVWTAPYQRPPKVALRGAPRAGVRRVTSSWPPVGPFQNVHSQCFQDRSPAFNRYTLPVLHCFLTLRPQRSHLKGGHYYTKLKTRAKANYLSWSLFMPHPIYHLRNVGQVLEWAPWVVESQSWVNLATLFSHSNSQGAELKCSR